MNYKVPYTGVSVANREITRRWSFDKVRDSSVATGTKQSLMSRVPIFSEMFSSRFEDWSLCTGSLEHR
jgi:hypothetical protein